MPSNPPPPPWGLRRFNISRLINGAEVVITVMAPNLEAAKRFADERARQDRS